MFAILAEDRSDAESLVTIVRRLIGTRNQSIRSKGFSGCGALCRKAGIQIQILIRKVIPTLSIKAVLSPESVESPKEWLIRESRKGRSRPLYVPSIHNPRVAAYIDLDVLAKKCPAFQPLKQFVSSV